MSKDQRRFMAIPFSSSCRSGSSVDVVDTRHGKKPQQDGAPANKPKGESLVARLLKGFKNLSQIFAVYEEDEEEEEEEREMVIGLPTDVKHVAHIGWDGSTNTAPSVRSWNRGPAASTSSAAAPAAPPPLSMRQFELAMAAQAAAGTGASASAAAASRHGHS